ncbi:hypothetical protein QFZ27_001899 [Inquilinus ginsengisoli]|uniref:DUF6519 domain-containing protein n=1 Tax=Inquilinus ginsengisoli TaxID=363840 RepID=UPI003D1F44D2
MSGDYSRKSFDALRDFSGVFMQQGHPTLDADWNEFVSIVERRFRTETVDIIGRAVVPVETPTGFEIQAEAGPQLTVGRGRMYVDGLLAENHGRIGPGAPPVFDRTRLTNGVATGVLDELISGAAGDFINYATQPYLPVPPALPQTAGPHLVYLDVWNREVTPLQDPRLLEPALAGIDTATRRQTVWQVRVLANVGAGATCGADLAAWDALVAPSAARLTNATIEFEDPDEPCLIPPGGGYRGLENQLYRVEIHTGGGLANARFKWSRENASVGATVETITGGDRLQVRRIGRDSVLRFRTGDWVEVTDDRRELAGLPGDVRRIEVDEDAYELRLEAGLSADLIPGGGADSTTTRHTRVIRWDQHGLVQLADSTDWVDLDDAASDGLIPVPPAGQAVVLEAGITVIFSLAPAAGQAKPMDYWCFAARTADASIEPLTNAPPKGVHHHYARLAMVTFPSTVVDCRTFWPPEFVEGDDCACTVCVTAEQHNNGTLTIQDAIAELPEEGGTICLGLGTFTLGGEPVVIERRRSVHLTGHGSGTVLAYGGAGAAVRVIDCEDIEIDDLGVFVGTTGEGAIEPPACFHLRNCRNVGLSRTTSLIIPRAIELAYGVALDGNQEDILIADNRILVHTGIGALADPERNGYCALGEIRIQNNEIAAFRGIALDGLVMHLANTRINFNAIGAFEVGLLLTGTGAPGGDEGEFGAVFRDPARTWTRGGVAVESNTILVGAAGDGVVSGAPNLHLTDNEIAAVEEGEADPQAAMVRLVDGFIRKFVGDAQIVGNRMGNTRGAGISIESRMATLIIKQNLIRDCGAGGVRMSPDAIVASLAFDNNIIERVGGMVGDAPAIGVHLSAIVDGKVIGNTIRGIGIGLDAEGITYYAGLQVRGAMLLDISDNTVGEVGPGDTDKPVWAIRLEAPIITLGVTSNRLIGIEEGQSDNTAWGGIVLAADFGGKELVGAGGYPGYLAIGERVMHLSQRGVSNFARSSEAQIRIEGNLIRDGHQFSQLPLVSVFAEVEKDMSALTFTANQCRRTAPEGQPSVQLAASRIAVANNMVRGPGELDSMALLCLFVGDRRALGTVTGNITSGRIMLNNNSLLPPWAALNVQA